MRSIFYIGCKSLFIWKYRRFSNAAFDYIKAEIVPRRDGGPGLATGRN
jgi:hypothetical protein